MLTVMMNSRGWGGDEDSLIGDGVGTGICWDGHRLVMGKTMWEWGADGMKFFTVLFSISHQSLAINSSTVLCNVMCIFKRKATFQCLSQIAVK